MNKFIRYSQLIVCFLSINLISCSQKTTINENLLVDKLLSNAENKLKKNIDLDSVEIVIKKAEQFINSSKEDKTKKYKCSLTYLQGFLYYRHGNFEKAINSLNHTRVIATKGNHLQVMNSVYYSILSKLALDSSLDVDLYIKNEIDKNAYSDLNNKLATYIGIGYYYNKAAKPSQAIPWLEKGEQLSSQLKDPPYSSNLYKQLAANYFDLGNPIKALEYTKETLKIAENANDKKAIKVADLNIATIQMSIGQHKEALKCFNSQLQKARLEENISNQIFTLSQMGTVNYQVKDFDKAAEYYTQALVLSASYNNNEMRETYKNTLLNLANTYIEIGEFDSALRISKEYFSSVGLLDKNVSTARYFEINAAIFQGLNLYNESKQAYLEGIEFAKKHKFKFTLNDLYLKYGKLLLRIGDVSESKKFFTKAYDWSVQSNHISFQHECLEALYQFYSKTGKDKLALDFYKKFIYLDDSIKNSSVLKKIKIEKLTYKFEKEELIKQQEINSLVSKSQIQESKLKSRNILLLLGFILLSLSTWFLIYRRRKNKKYTELLNAKNKELLNHNVLIQGKNVDLNKKQKDLQEKQHKLEDELRSKLILIATNQNKLEEMKELVGNSKDMDPSLKRTLSSKINFMKDEKILNQVNLQFSSVHEVFYKMLSQVHPLLSPSNIKMATYLKMNLSSKEIALIEGTSTESVKVARFRLRKKLDLPDKKISLVAYFNSMEIEQKA